MKILIAQGLRDTTAYTCLRELQEHLRDPDRTVPHFMLQLLRSLLTDRVRPAGPLLATEEEQKIAVFVGPSGVGKTTTIAKLAAFYRLEEKRSVALVTIDNYRPAAVEQLRLYANVLGVDLATSSTGEEARDCMAQFNQAELILVDTPGFNPMQRLPVDYWMPFGTLSSAIGGPPRPVCHDQDPGYRHVRRPLLGCPFPPASLHQTGRDIRLWNPI